MSGDIHYEVFFKKNRKSGWALVEALSGRDEAIKLAHTLVAKHKTASVRVSKECYDCEARTFRSVPVFKSGADEFEVEEKTGVATLSCLTPDDLSKPHARDTIRRVLSGWLERVQAVPMELLHRADLVEDLEAADTELQHAVQKVAVASAQNSDANVQHYVKQLNELVQKALGRIYKDAREDRLPAFPQHAKFSDIASEIHGGGRRAYALRSAMADRLRDAGKYGDKLEALLEMSDDLPEDTEVREFAVTEVDSYAAEVITFAAGMDALLGECKDLGETLERLACLFDGDHSADALKSAPKAARRLAQKIASGDFEACRGVIAAALLTALERPQRLRPASVREELRLARDLARKLVMSADSLLPADALAKAFTARSSRLLQPDTVDELLLSANDTDEKIGRLLGLEENLVGETNKQKLAGYVRTVLCSSRAERWFMRREATPLERLAILTAQQARVLGGTYPPADRIELAASFDRVGMKIIDDSKILNMVEGGDRPALDKATAMLKLATGGALPVGQCSSDAQARAMRLLKSAMGLNEAQQADGKDKLRNIEAMFKQLETARARIKPAS